MKKKRLTETECEAVIQIVALKNKVDPRTVREGMEEQLSEMWSSDDPEVKRRQKTLFGDGRPDLERFIYVMSEQFRDR